ncbi:cytochrome P450 [Leptodontidium sp. 2 PMI_412]|nr:cytochrome P450 [Leptodontidium sp. 2 PMI_412]
MCHLLYFHPLSKLPGPRIAAISNVWYAYHWQGSRLSERYPWAIENALRNYGDVVRIAPNELVFVTPQASIDIYSPHQKRLESFVKTNVNDRGKDLGGIIWQEHPVKHREVAKKVSLAFSNRSLKAMEPMMHKYMDYFVKKMKQLGGAPDGIELGRWTEWLAMDMSADLSWSEEMDQMRNMKNSVYLDVLLGFNTFTTVIQVFKRFPLLSPFQFFAAPVAKLSSFAAMEKITRDSVGERVDKRGTTEHVDFFESIMPADSPLPTDLRELTHLGSVAVQLMFAGFNPMSDWFYSTVFFLLEDDRHTSKRTFLLLPEAPVTSTIYSLFAHSTGFYQNIRFTISSLPKMNSKASYLSVLDRDTAWVRKWHGCRQIIYCEGAVAV